MNKIAANLPRTNEKLLFEFANEIVLQASANVKSRSKYVDRDIKLERHPKGTLANSIVVLEKSSTNRGPKAVVGIEPHSPAVNYAAVVEEGRKGGKTIRAKFVPKLRFRWSKGPFGKRGMKTRDFFTGESKFSGYHFYKKVKQGPSRPMHFMKDGIRQANNIMRPKLQDRINRIIQRK